MTELTEHQIQDQIIQYLGMRGYFVMRLNSGMLPMGEGRSRRMIRMLPAGTPDLMAFKTRWITRGKADAQWVDLLFIECKRPGKKPTQLQRQKMEELESFGARCIVATCIEDVEEVIGS